MPHRNSVFAAALMVFCCLFAAGCGAPPVSNTATGSKLDPKTNGVRGGKLTYRMATAPQTLNYLQAKDEFSIVSGFFTITGRLVDFDNKEQKFVPGLAESWTMSPDGMTVDIKLREGLKFSDGNDLTTDDVIFTLAAMYDEKVNSPVYRDAMMVDGKQIAARKVNEREMQMVFPKPVASAETYLVNVGVLPSHILESQLKSGTLAEAWKINAPPATIISSGPFIVESVTPGERIEYARNPNYWKKDSAGTQLPYLDNFAIEIVSDPNSAFVRLSQGSLDFADRVRPSDFNEFTKTQGAMRAIDAGPGLSIDHIFFNLNTATPDGKPLDNQVKRAWFADKRFRQALAMAVDRESIAAVILQGLASPLHGFVSPANQVWLKPDLAKIEYSLPRAEQMLKEAGFNKSGPADAPVLTDAQNNPVEFTLIVAAENEPRKQTATVFQQDLAKLGIKMQVVPIENSTISARWSKSYDYDAILLGLSLTDIEPTSYGNFLLSSASAHQWHPNQKTPATEWEARIDKLFTEQSVELDRQKRMALFHEIQAIMREEMPVIPLIARHVAAAGHTKIANYAPSSIFPYSLWNVDELFVKQ